MKRGEVLFPASIPTPLRQKTRDTGSSLTHHYATSQSSVTMTSLSFPYPLSFSQVSILLFILLLSLPFLAYFAGRGHRVLLPLLSNIYMASALLEANSKFLMGICFPLLFSACRAISWAFLETRPVFLVALSPFLLCANLGLVYPVYLLPAYTCSIFPSYSRSFLVPPFRFSRAVLSVVRILAV